MFVKFWKFIKDMLKNDNGEDSKKDNSEQSHSPQVDDSDQSSAGDDARNEIEKANQPQKEKDPSPSENESQKDGEGSQDQQELSDNLEGPQGQQESSDNLEDNQSKGENQSSNEKGEEGSEIDTNQLGGSNQKPNSSPSSSQALEESEQSNLPEDSESSGGDQADVTVEMASDEEIDDNQNLEGESSGNVENESFFQQQLPSFSLPLDSSLPDDDVTSDDGESDNSNGDGGSQMHIDELEEPDDSPTSDSELDLPEEDETIDVDDSEETDLDSSNDEQIESQEAEETAPSKSTADNNLSSSKKKDKNSESTNLEEKAPSNEKESDADSSKSKDDEQSPSSDENIDSDNLLEEMSSPDSTEMDKNPDSDQKPTENNNVPDSEPKPQESSENSEKEAPPEQKSVPQRENLQSEKEPFEPSEEQQYTSNQPRNEFFDRLGELPSFENRERGPGYSIDENSNTELPESIIRTLISKFLNQRFCKRNSDLNHRTNSLEKIDGFYKWNIKDVIVHSKTHQLTKVLNDKYGYDYADGKNENVPLSFYFDMSGSMSNYSNLLATIAIELLKKDVKVLVGFNERVNVQFESADKNISVKDLALLLQSAGFSQNVDSFLQRSDICHIKYKLINRNIDNYLIDKKAEKCVVFSDFDPRYEVIKLSQKTQVYWFCFEHSYGRYDLDNFNGFIYPVHNANDILDGLIKVNEKRFETLCYVDNGNKVKVKEM